MADEVFDIIHRIVYEVDDTALENVQAELNKQLSTLDTLGKRQIKLAEIYNKTATQDDANRKRANRLMRENAQAMEKVGSELENTVINNKQFNKALTEEIGLINTLNYRLQVLQDRRKKATSETDVKRYNTLIQQERARINSLSPTQRPTRPNVPRNGPGIGGLGLGSVARMAAPILAGVSLVNFGKEIFDITSRFQTYNNTLRNTFQSSQKAGEAFAMLKDFAAKTPFDVDKLTASYIKLVNRGFEPTKDELTNLGDLAASQGKSFDQLTEAVLDAQTGEFERLKEFGIRAKTTGDTVTLAFRGIERQVKKTDQEGLRNAVLSFGKLQGVAGSMATVAQGLEGKVSNLGDSFDSLKNSIGERSTGLFTGLIDGAAKLVDTFNELIAKSPAESLREQQAEVNGLIVGIMSLNEGEEARSMLITELNVKYPELLKNLNLEKLSNEQLQGVLNGVNQSFERRIALATTAYQKEALLNKQQNIAKNLAAAISDSDIQAMLKDVGELDNFLAAAGDLEKQLVIAQRASAARAKAGKTGFLEGFGFGSNISDLTSALNEAIKQTPKLANELGNIATQENAQQKQQIDRFNLLLDKVKAAGGFDAIANQVKEGFDLILSGALSSTEAGEFNLLADQYLKKNPIKTKPTTTNPTGTKKRTAAEAQADLMLEFQAELRKSLIRDEVKDYIKASQDIEADRQKRLEKIEKLEKEYKTKFSKARITNDEIVANDELREREAYEAARLKLIEDNEQRISDLLIDSQLKRAQLMKATFQVENQLLRRELARQQQIVDQQRQEAINKLVSDAQKGLYGNLERAADGVNLPRDTDGNIVVRFIRVDDKGQPVKNADGTFQEDLEALERFQELVTDTNNYYNDLREGNEEGHAQKLLDIQEKYFIKATSELKDFLQQQNVEITKEYSQQIDTITQAYLKGESSLKKYTEAVSRENKKLAKEQLAAQLEGLGGEGLANGYDINKITGGQVGQINRVLQRGGYTETDENGKEVFTKLDDLERNDLLRQRRDLEQQILEILIKQNEAAANDKSENDEKKNEALQKVVSSYQQISSAAIQAAQTVVSTEQERTDRQLQIQERRIDRAQRIADRGNAELLQREEERLAKLQAQKERYAQNQVAINSVLTLSNSIAAIAAAAGESGAGAIVIIPLVLAALAAGYSAVSSFTRDTTPAFKDGIVDFRGAGGPRDDKNLIRISNRESVMTAPATAAHKDILKEMNAGKRFTMETVGGANMLVPIDNQRTMIGMGGNATSEADISELKAKLDEVTTAIKERQPSSLTFDRRGIVAVIDEIKTTDKRRWKV